MIDHYEDDVCLLEKVNFVHIRAISNYVEPRNKEGWDIPLALDNLSEFLVKLLNNLVEK